VGFIAAPTFEQFSWPGLELESFVSTAAAASSSSAATPRMRLWAWPPLIHICHLRGRLTLSLTFVVLLLFGYGTLYGAGGGVSAARGLPTGYALDFDLQESLWFIVSIPRIIRIPGGMGILHLERRARRGWLI